MKLYKHIILFLAIFLIGVFLRFYQLGNVPNSLNWDEVSWGYNAYSILKTGFDEHGVFMPSTFEAFGDYKQPVYVYLASISVSIFGLNSFAVRFPSALLGVLTAPFVWILVFSLFKKEKYAMWLAYLSMFLFVISPWSIQFSRVAYEANVGLFFVLSGAAIFLYGLQNQRRLFLYLSLIPLVISGYSYHSQKLFTPVLFLALLFLSFQKFRLSRKHVIALFALFVFGSSFWLFDVRTTARGRSVTFVSNQTPLLKDSTEKIIYDNERNDHIGSFFHNRRIVYINQYLENYLKHFYPNYLFILGDNPRHHAPGMGVLFLASLPMILLGMIVVDKKKYWLVLFWFFLAPVASALATDAPNASRSLIFLPTWQILEALGILWLLHNRKKKVNFFALCMIIIILIFNFIYFFHQYFFHTNTMYQNYWQYGYKESLIRANEYSNDNKRVFVSNEFEQGYIFYLFHTRYDPKKYLEKFANVKKKECFSIENIFFGNCQSKMQKGDLYLSLNPQDQKQLIRREVVFDLNNQVVGYVYEVL